FALLNHTQQLGLRFRADGRDFVKENRALIRHFEQPLFRGYGARKGALYVTKKLRFQKIDGNGSGVHGHKGSVRSRRSGVQRLGDELLARATLSADEHSRTRRRHLRNEIQQYLYLVALAHYVGEIEALLEGPLKYPSQAGPQAALQFPQHSGQERQDA